MIHFRPRPWLTGICLLAIALLVTLGTWQAQRLQWKLDLIAKVEARLAASSQPLRQVLAETDTLEEALYRKVSLRGRFDHAREIYLFTSKGVGTAGYQVITPLILEDGSTILIDRGFVPEGLRDPATRPEGQVGGKVEVIGLLRLAVPKSTFTPDPDIAGHTWYHRDPVAMAASIGISETLEVMIDANAAPNPGGYPQGGKTIVTFTNNHLAYAITWYGLAFALLAVYMAFHAKEGRLQIGEGRVE